MIVLMLEWLLFNFECGLFTCASHSPFSLALRPATLTFLAITMLPLISNTSVDRQVCTTSHSGKSSSAPSSLRSFSLSASITSMLSSTGCVPSVTRHDVLASSATPSLDALSPASKPREGSWRPLDLQELDLQEPFLLNHAEAEQGSTAFSTERCEGPGIEPCSCHRPVSNLAGSIASSVSSTALPSADAPAPASLPSSDIAVPGMVDAQAAEAPLVQQLASIGPAAQARTLVLYNIEVSQGPAAAQPSSPGPAVHSSLYTSTTERKLISIKVCCHLPMLCWECTSPACLPSCCLSDAGISGCCGSGQIIVLSSLALVGVASQPRAQ